MKLLIAEDEKMLLKTMAFFLEKRGYDITQVFNGNDAVEVLKKETFDLIITDINMPFITGMEIINIVRNELHLSVPIIVLTSVGLEKTELSAFEIGASEFITKPFSLPVLATRVEKLLLQAKK
ncbi:MAG TPA: response regulator transcription factor [Cytophagaceae bacterium]|jgi:DNA-binding response OmpR family regulator|nr:response regulator transcription factor [Cytophagaceae bacterium]